FHSCQHYNTIIAHFQTRQASRSSSRDIALLGNIGGGGGSTCFFPKMEGAAVWKGALEAVAAAYLAGDEGATAHEHKMTVDASNCSIAQTHFHAPHVCRHSEHELELIALSFLIQVIKQSVGQPNDLVHTLQQYPKRKQDLISHVSMLPQITIVSSIFLHLASAIIKSLYIELIWYSKYFSLSIHELNHRYFTPTTTSQVGCYVAKEKIPNQNIKMLAELIDSKKTENKGKWIEVKSKLITPQSTSIYMAVNTRVSE
ncbi:hypothetical protein ACJX0J_032307, partial [Zea mays]